MKGITSIYFNPFSCWYFENPVPDYLDIARTNNWHETSPDNCPKNNAKVRPEYEPRTMDQWIELEDLGDLPDDGNLLMLGDGGSGKTTKLYEMYKELLSQGKSVMAFTFTHAARQQLVQTGFQLDHTSTLDSYFAKKHRICPDIFMIDEVSMVNKRLMGMVMQECEINNCRIIFTGDFKQCKPVETDGIYINYLNNPRFIKLLKYLYVKPYLAERS